MFEMKIYLIIIFLTKKAELIEQLEQLKMQIKKEMIRTQTISHLYYKELLNYQYISIKCRSIVVKSIE